MARKTSRIVEAILETAEGMHRIGMLSDEEYKQITVRHLGEKSPPMVKPIGAKEIKKIRQQAKMSQAAFARHLSLTPGYISQLERGTKEPKGPALVLLNVIRRNGIEVVL